MSIAIDKFSDTSLRYITLSDSMPEMFVKEDELTLDSFKKEMATPPRPGLVFDRQKHRWIRPTYGKEHYEVDFSRELEEMDDFLGKLRHREATFEELGETLNGDEISKLKTNVDSRLGQYERFFDAETFNKAREIGYKLISHGSRMSPKYTPNALQDLVSKAVDTLIYCEARSWERQMSDHGIRHVSNNINTMNRIFDAMSAKGTKVSDKEVFLSHLVMVFHDIGYTAGPVRESIPHTKQHQLIGRRWFENNKEFFKKYLSKDELDLVADLIEHHDTTEIDWENKRLLTTISLSDNLSIFHTEKLPALFRYVNGSIDSLYELSRAIQRGDEKAIDNARFELDKKINISHLPEYAKSWLKRAVAEVSPFTVKVAIPMLIGRIKHFDWDHNTGLSIDIDEHPFDSKMAEFFDMGQNKYKKLAEDYGVELADNDHMKFEKNGRQVLELRIKRNPVVISKEMPVAPRPGLVFDRTRHRWVRPYSQSTEPKSKTPIQSLLKFGAFRILTGKRSAMKPIGAALSEVREVRGKSLDESVNVRGQMMVDEWTQGRIADIYALRMLAAKMSGGIFTREDIKRGLKSLGDFNEDSINLIIALGSAKFLALEGDKVGTSEAEKVLRDEKAFAEKRTLELFGKKIKVYRAIYGKVAEELMKDLKENGEATVDTMPLASYSQDRTAAFAFGMNNAREGTGIRRRVKCIVIEREIEADEVQFAWYTNPIFLEGWSDQFEIVVASKHKKITLKADQVSEVQ